MNGSREEDLFAATRALEVVMQQVVEVTEQVAALTVRVAALALLGDLATFVRADAAGNVSITLPPGGAFVVRQGEAPSDNGKGARP